MLSGISITPSVSYHFYFRTHPIASHNANTRAKSYNMYPNSFIIAYLSSVLYPGNAQLPSSNRKCLSRNQMLRSHNNFPATRVGTPAFGLPMHKKNQP